MTETNAIDCSAAEGERRPQESSVQPADVASFLQQSAAKFRKGKINALAQGLCVDSTYCDAAAIVVEQLAEVAQREGWTRTRSAG